VKCLGKVYLQALSAKGRSPKGRRGKEFLSLTVQEFVFISEGKSGFTRDSVPMTSQLLVSEGSGTTEHSLLMLLTGCELRNQDQDDLRSRTKMWAEEPTRRWLNPGRHTGLSKLSVRSKWHGIMQKSPTFPFWDFSKAVTQIWDVNPRYEATKSSVYIHLAVPSRNWTLFQNAKYCWSLSSPHCMTVGGGSLV